MEDYEAIVIGGGLAGLAAARDLGVAGRRVLVLEARERLGGRTWVRRFAGSSVELDFGGTWVLPEHHPAVMAELERYGIATRPTPAPERFVNVLAGERLGTPEIPADELASLHERARAAVAATPGATLAEVLSAPGIGTRARAWATAYGRYLNGADPREVDGAHLLDGYGFAEPDHYFHKIEGGTRHLVEALAGEAAADLRLGAAVTVVEDAGGAVAVHLADGGRATAAAAVVALPVNVWPDVSFAPALSGPRQALAAAGHVGHSVKVWALVEAVADVVRGLADDGPIAYLRTERVLPDGRSLLVGFGAEADFDPTDLDAVQHAIRHLLPEARVVACDGHDWNGDPWSRGTWFAARPGQPSLLQAGAGDRTGRLAFAGADLSPTTPGTLDGAIATGRTAAAAIAGVLDAARAA